MKIGRRLRVFGLGLVLAVVLAAIPFVASADGPTSFTASGGLVQIDPGVSVPTVSSGLPGGFPDGIPGSLTTGQVFVGELTDSTWEDLEGSSIVVDHNSFLTFADGVPDFLPAGSEALIGVAFGTFGVENDDGDVVTGGYVAALAGTLSIDPTCTLSGLRVIVTDTGGFVVGISTGDFDEIGSAGALVVTAEGCLGAEFASIELSGIEGVDEDEDDDDDDEDDEDEDDEGSDD